MKTYTIICTDDETGKQVQYEFTSRIEYEKKLNEIKYGYFVLTEKTITALEVARMKDLFDTGE